jgi:hypothetical protein
MNQRKIKIFGKPRHTIQKPQGRTADKGPSSESSRLLQALEQANLEVFPNSTASQIVVIDCGDLLSY